MMWDDLKGLVPQLLAALPRAERGKVTWIELSGNP